METLNKVIELVYNHWELVVGLPIVSLLLSAFQQKVNKWFSVQSDKVKTFITLALSSLPVAVPAILGFIQTNPQFLGAATTAVFTLMTVIYRVFIKPFSAQLSAFRDYKASQSVAATPIPAIADTVVTAPVVVETPQFTPRVFQG
jgi:hypothetical protein